MIQLNTMKQYLNVLNASSMLPMLATWDVECIRNALHGMLNAVNELRAQQEAQPTAEDNAALEHLNAMQQALQAVLANNQLLTEGITSETLHSYLRTQLPESIELLETLLTTPAVEVVAQVVVAPAVPEEEPALTAAVVAPAEELEVAPAAQAEAVPVQADVAPAQADAAPVQAVQAQEVAYTMTQQEWLQVLDSELCNFSMLIRVTNREDAVVSFRVPTQLHSRLRHLAGVLQGVDDVRVANLNAYLANAVVVNEVSIYQNVNCRWAELSALVGPVLAGENAAQLDAALATQPQPEVDRYPEDGAGVDDDGDDGEDDEVADGEAHNIQNQAPIAIPVVVVPPLDVPVFAEQEAFAPVQEQQAPVAPVEPVAPQASTLEAIRERALNVATEARGFFESLQESVPQRVAELREQAETLHTRAQTALQEVDHSTLMLVNAGLTQAVEKLGDSNPKATAVLRAAQQSLAALDPTRFPTAEPTSNAARAVDNSINKVKTAASVVSATKNLATSGSLLGKLMSAASPKAESAEVVGKAEISILLDVLMLDTSTEAGIRDSQRLAIRMLQVLQAAGKEVDENDVSLSAVIPLFIDHCREISK